MPLLVAIKITLDLSPAEAHIFPVIGVRTDGAPEKKGGLAGGRVVALLPGCAGSPLSPEFNLMIDF